MKRAVAIRTFGDPEIGDALGNALVVQTESGELESLREELREMKKREAKFGVREVRDQKYFNDKILELRESKPLRTPGKVEQIVLVAWALTALALVELFRRLDDWVIRSARGE